MHYWSAIEASVAFLHLQARHGRGHQAANEPGGANACSTERVFRVLCRSPHSTRLFSDIGCTPAAQLLVVSGSHLIHPFFGAHRGNGKRSVTAEPTPPMFPIRSEKDLEDYLVANPSLLGEDLLIIGRQVGTVGGIIDLLAIDSTGAMSIVELKLGKALPAVIAQVLGYRRSIKRLEREMVIRLAADGGLGIHLTQAFEQRFGRPLPTVVNQSQQIIIVAASVHAITAGGILALLDDGSSITTFRYVAGLDAVSLIPCCRSDRDVEEGTHLETKLSAPPKGIIVEPTGKGRYPVDKTVRRFWMTHAQDLSPFVTFSFLFERYELWAEAQGIPLHQSGQFGRQLSAITAETNEWTRVFVSRHRDMAAYNTFMAPPDTRLAFGGDYTVVAYKRSPIELARDL